MVSFISFLSIFLLWSDSDSDSDSRFVPSASSRHLMQLQSSEVLVRTVLTLHTHVFSLLFQCITQLQSLQ